MTSPRKIGSVLGEPESCFLLQWYTLTGNIQQFSVKGPYNRGFARTHVGACACTCELDVPIPIHYVENIKQMITCTCNPTLNFKYWLKYYVGYFRNTLFVDN
jgi:hypothetical protein